MKELKYDTKAQGLTGNLMEVMLEKDWTTMAIKKDNTMGIYHQLGLHKAVLSSSFLVTLSQVLVASSTGVSSVMKVGRPDISSLMFDKVFIAHTCAWATFPVSIDFQSLFDLIFLLFFL